MKVRFHVIDIIVIVVALTALCLPLIPSSTLTVSNGTSTQNGTANLPPVSLPSPRRTPQRHTKRVRAKCGSTHNNVLKEGLGMEFVEIPPGSFEMGSKQKNEFFGNWPLHPVTFKEGFSMGKYEVTQVQWQTLMDYNHSSHRGDDCLPVENVSWDEAREFTRRLSKMSDRYMYRLPSEAEWEYACRAGTTTAFSFGEDLDRKLANFDPALGAAKTPSQQTMPVGKFPCNGFGLCDMHGNVEEWCEDEYHKDYIGAPADGRTWESGNEQAPRVARESGDEQAPRVTRGCSYLDSYIFCRSNGRNFYNPRKSYLNVGFRVVRVAKP